MEKKKDTACVLCGAAVPWGRRNKGGASGRYCCSGCEHVAAILESVPEEQGQRLLAQARRMGIVPAEGQGPSDAPPGTGSDGPAVPAEAERAERFSVDGLACPSCAWLVSAVLTTQPGVAEVETDFLSDSVRVRYDMRRTGPDALAAPLSGLGYRLSPLDEDQSPEEARFSRLLARFLLALFLALNAMMLSAVHWAAYVELIPPVDLRTVAVIQLVLVLPLIGLGVWPLFRRSLALIRLGRPSMDLLFVLGFTAAFALSVAAFFTDRSQFYFDTCGAFVAISLFGRLVEGKLRLRAARGLRGLLEISATKVAVEEPDGKVAYLPVDRVEPGQVIRVEPGQTVAFDGSLAGEQAGLVSEAMLTGEPALLLKRPGEAIQSGSVAAGDPLSVRVVRPYREGRLQQIADGIAQALTRNELRLRSADRVAFWFVPTVLLLAAATFLGRMAWTGDGPLSADVWMPTISVLLVACPCAFGIATASALAVAVSALLRHGVLVKDGGALERLGGIDLLALDKTGTLTTGRWQIEAVRWFTEEDHDLLAGVAALEAGVDHPVAHALRAHLVRGEGIEPVEVSEREVIGGQGVVGRIPAGRLAVGQPGLFDQAPALDEVPERTTVICFGLDGRVAGWFELSDAIRPGTREVIDWFAQRGVEPVVLSGDRPEVAASVAAELGIERAAGGLTPDDKRARVLAWTEDGRRVAFTGDGSNDAPAMAEAEVAISLRHGTDLSLSAAHLLPLSGDLTLLPKVVQAAGLTQRTIWRNYLWAFGYNALFLPLAALGLLHPIFAAGLMFASSVTVLVQSLRLRGKLDAQWQSGEPVEDPAAALEEASG